MMNKLIQSYGASVRFNHFTRKPYAIFGSLNRRVTIGVLSVGMLNFIGTLTVQAQDATSNQTPQTVALDEVEVLGSRTPLTVSQAARIVTVIGKQEIAAAPVRTVNDLLKYAVGVDVRQRGAMGIQTDIGIRGGTADQITILLNGVNISDPQTGHNAMDIPIDISRIERIEVLEGPAGRAYGTSSLLGAINIITTVPEKSQLTAHAEGGSYGYANTGIGINLLNHHFTHGIFGSYSRADGYSRNNEGQLNSDFTTAKAFYEGAYRSSENVKLKWWGGYSQKDYGANTFYSAKFDNQFEQTRKIFTALQAETQWDFFRLKTSAYWNRSYDRFEMVRGQKPNRHRTDVTGADINGYLTTPIGKTALGITLRNEGIISTGIGDPLHHTTTIGNTGQTYTNGVDRTLINAFIEHNIVLRRFTLSAGIVAGQNTYDQTGFRIYPGVDASYQLARDWKLYASYNTSARYPNFTEMFYNYPGYKANKYLEPESMEAFELGVKYLTPAIRATLSGYYHKGSNLIDWIMLASAGTDAAWESVNLLHINSKGIETTFETDFTQLFPAQTWLGKLKLSYNYISQDKQAEPGQVSKYALEYLRHKLVAQTTFHLSPALLWSISYRWQERIGNYIDLQGAVHRYTPYGLLDTRFSFSRPRYSLYLEANNLLNRTYYDYGSVPQPGCWFRIGGSYSVNL